MSAGRSVGTWGAGLPRTGAPDFARTAAVRSHQARERRIIAADEERQAEIRRRVAEGPAPNRSFAEQIDALRRICDRQLALMEAKEQADGILPYKEFVALQKLAFTVRSLSMEARANAVGFDASHASDEELRMLAGESEVRKP